MVFSFIIRCGLVVGAVYYTRRLGVWGNTKETETLYNNLKSEIKPHVQKLEKELPFEVPAMPQSGEIRFLAKHYFNQGVKETFHFIGMLPTYTENLAKKATVAINEFVEPPEPTTPNAKPSNAATTTSSK